MSALSGSELAARLKPETARSLQVLAFAMGQGVFLLAAASVFFARRAAGTPSAEAVRRTNALTALAMAAAFTAIAASELLWRRLLARAGEATLDAAVRQAFVVRTALREGGALLGGVVALLAALDGTLRAYPAYWVCLIPALLFGSYLYVHWPSLENLKSEAAAALPASPAA